MTKLQVVTYLAYSMPVWVIGAYWLYNRRKSKRNQANLNSNIQAGLTEPASLHPVIDKGICIGCGACVSACPENDVLGLIKGKAELINPTHCIGHSACAAACPVDGITLVFGTSKRGMDIPHVKPNFETNIPGLFIAGELGGMGLIRNAVKQGTEAINEIARHKNIKSGTGYDVVIIGAGPAGMTATLAAKEKKLNYLTLEQDSLGGTVFKYPRGKVVMTAPMKLPVFGTINIRETTKEKLLGLWSTVEKKSGIKINYREKMENIEKIENGFNITSIKNSYQAKTVLLAIGRRGTPRKLGVDGEDQPKVVYELIDAEQYRNKHVLVVGGGDSALEAAISIANEPGTQVAISYRSESFSRAKEKNRQLIENAHKEKGLNIILSSTVKKINEKTVEIDQQGKVINLQNDAVIVCAGGILPTPFLKQIGIEVETKHGTV